MNIVQLVDRFEYYARVNTDLAHNPADKKQTSFLECDIDELATAVKNGLKFPCLLFQTPQFEKKGNQDNIIEFIEGSFLILKPWKEGSSKSQLYQECKDIADQVINYMVEDSDEYFEAALVETSEGPAGPTTDRLIGWGVNFGFSQGYNGEVDESKRRAI